MAENKINALRREVADELKYLNALNYILNNPEYKYFLYDLSLEDQEKLLKIIDERDIIKVRWWLRNKIKGLQGQPVHIIYAAARSLGINPLGKDKEQIIALILEKRKPEIDKH